MLAVLSRICGILFAVLVLSAGSAAAVTVSVTNAKTSQANHYYGDYESAGGGDIGAFASIWTKNNWKTAIVWLRPVGSRFFKDFWIDCLSYECKYPGAAAYTEPWVNTHCPCSQIYINSGRPFKYALFGGDSGPVEAWEVLSGNASLSPWRGGFALNMGFFGNELVHKALITLDDRSRKRYDFVLWDAPDKRKYNHDGSTYGSATGLASGLGLLSVASVPLPASGVLFVSLLASVIGFAGAFSARRDQIN